MTFETTEAANDAQYYERIQLTGVRVDVKEGCFVDDQRRKWFPAPLWECKQ